MKNKLTYSLMLLLEACSSSSNNNSNQNETITINQDRNMQQETSITYIDKKREPFTNGQDNYNEMVLYSIGDTINIERLKEFCLKEKKKITDGMFHILVFFDKKENAEFPNNPVTALYMNEKPSKHIKAIYTYNKGNDYSKLSYYENNSWESKANQIDIK